MADKPSDPYSGELGCINLRLLARKMQWVLRYLKRQGVYHPAMDDLIAEGYMHGLGLEGPIPDPAPAPADHPAATEKVSDRERRLEEAVSFYARDEDRYINGEGEAFGSIPTDIGAFARSVRRDFELKLLAQESARTACPHDHACCRQFEEGN